MTSFASVLTISVFVLWTLYATAEAKQSVDFEKKHHRILPNDMLKYFAHLHGKPKKTDEKKKSMLRKDASKAKNVHQRKQLKKELPQITYRLTANHTTTGMKRIPPVVASVASKALGNEKVQEAIVEKGIEVVGNAIDKQMANIETAQNKSEAFLNKRIKLDISPEKGWEQEDMFIPPGYHMNAEIESERKSAKNEEQGEPVYTYPAGIGNIMMNGCWGTGYKPGDPCYKSFAVSTACQNMIDGAAFIGVGFDGRGKYSPESRKMSIIQRSCGGRS